MKALRRVTKQDKLKSELLCQLSIQAFLAGDTGQISTKTTSELLEVFHRTHTGIMVGAGCIDRMKQKRYDERNKLINTKWLKLDANSDAFYIFACSLVFAVTLLFAWVVTK